MAPGEGAITRVEGTLFFFFLHSLERMSAAEDACFERDSFCDLRVTLTCGDIFLDSIKAAKKADDIELCLLTRQKDDCQENNGTRVLFLFQ